MSRKRKPVLQLGSSNSKLHKYGYSKEFHAADKKGKTVLPTLVGNYSDSEDDEAPNEGDEQAQKALEPVTDAPEASVQQDTSDGNHMREHANKSPDIDDELKNFLSEIEAIPMPPAEGRGEQENKSEQRTENLEEPKSKTGLSPKEPVVELASASDNVGEHLEDSSLNKEAGTSSSKPKSRYSMFVKGESEFVHSPTSQETEASAAKADDSETKGVEEEIPEEPTSCWQLVQDEGSQYYYYWNTLTNEVTWEIPSEYTQFLLLHREFTEKLARLPPHVLKAYEEKKAKEAEAFGSASNPACESVATSDTHAQQTTVYGPAARSSPTPESYTSHHLQRKHKKEKKKRRHKRRHSDSSDESSDARSDGEASRAPTYGPQLPKTKNSSASASGTKDSNVDSSAAAAAVGPQLLSIVPYLSDADEDESGEEGSEGEQKDSALVPGKGKGSASESRLGANSSDASPHGVKKDTENGSEMGVSDETALDTKNAKLGEETKDIPAEPEGVASEKKSGGEESHFGVQTDGRDTPTQKASSKSKKAKKEVIDMFAEDFVPKENKSPEDNKCIEDENISERENEAGKILQDVKVKQTTKLSHATPKGSPSASPKTTASSFSATSEFSTSVALKTNSEIVKGKSKDRKDAAKLLHIVGYESDEEEQKVRDEGGKSKLHKEVKREEDVLPLVNQPPSSSSSSSVSPSEAKKRKKDKKKHKHDERERKKEAEEGRDVLPTIMGNNLEREIIAKVEETLDKEISDIVIHTVSQSSVALLSGQTPSKQLLGSLQAEDKRAKKHPRLDKETRKAQSGREHLESLKKQQEAKKPLAKPIKAGEEKLSADSAIVSSELVKHEKETNGENAHEDDDDDIDFEDLDDLDRALEVALEKKKVELAKYEEKERNQQKELALAAAGRSEPDAEIAQTEAPDHKVEPLQAVEEKVKGEVKDAAELALSKLEFLDISTENLSRLQILFIELQTRLHDWSTGGLSTSYFQDQLAVAQALLEQYEQSAVPHGWACQWDRGNNRYYYRNLTTNRIQWDYPDEDREGKGPSGDGNGDDSNLNLDGAGKDEEEASKKTSSRKSEKTRERKSTDGAGSGEDKENLRRKGSSGSRHRKREERDKDRGSKHDKRRDGSGSSHRYRRKRRRRREHSSSSASSEDDGGGGDALEASKSSSVTSTGSGSRRHHRHHHKGSKKKRKRRSEQRSRSPSIEIVACTNSRDGSGKENDENDKSTPSVTVLDASPTNSSVVSTPYLDDDAAVSKKPAPPPVPSGESIDGQPLVKNGDIGGDVDGVAYHEDTDVDGVSLEAEESKPRGGGEAAEEGEVGEEEENEKEEDREEEKEAEPINTAVIYKPPQIVVPPRVVAAARQPELYGVPQSAAATTQASLSSSSLQAPPSVESAPALTQGQSSQHSSEGPSEAGEDSDKQGRKKKKEKKLATGPSLMMKKKHMSSMVQKWQKVKKEVEKEDRAKEIRQAAIRKKIEELK